MFIDMSSISLKYECSISKMIFFLLFAPSCLNVENGCEKKMIPVGRNKKKINVHRFGDEIR